MTSRYALREFWKGLPESEYWDNHLRELLRPTGLSSDKVDEITAQWRMPPNTISKASGVPAGNVWDWHRALVRKVVTEPPKEIPKREDLEPIVNHAAFMSPFQRVMFVADRLGIGRPPPKARPQGQKVPAASEEAKDDDENDSTADPLQKKQKTNDENDATADSQGATCGMGVEVV